VREMGNRLGEAKFLRALGEVAVQRNDLAGARKLFLASLSLSLEVGNQPEICICLQGITHLEITTGHPERAATILGAIEAAREALGLRPSFVDLLSYEPHVERLRALLPEPAFTLAWSQGRTMSLEEAVAYTLNNGLERVGARRIMYSQEAAVGFP